MQQRVQTLDSKLRAIQLGRDPLTLANAAVLYEYAFSYIHSIDHTEQEALEMVRSFISVLGTTDGLPERAVTRARKALARLKPARALVARAAACEQCTWEEAATAKRLGLAIGEGAWVRPMRALARICELEGALAISERRYRDADRAIADALAVAIHLADGSHLLGSVVAAATVVEVAELSALIIKSEGLHDSRTKIEERLARIDRRDPLAWKASRETTLRSRLHNVLGRRFAIEESSLASRIPKWNLDRLASITYVLQNRSATVGPLLSLDDVVLQENIEGSYSRIRATGNTLDQVLMIIDATQPIRTKKWRTRALLALNSIQDDLSYSPKRLAGSSSGP